jgi:2-aminoadipate transaminase
VGKDGVMNYDALLSHAGQRMQQSAIRQMGTVAAENPHLISFAPGYPTPEAFAWEDYQALVQPLLGGADPSVLQYGPTRGYRPLLEWLVTLLSRRGIATRVEDLLVTTGSQQGLDLVSRVLLDPGDVVLVELPSYTGALTAFRNAQATLVGIRQQPDGLSIEHLEATTRQLRAEGRRVKFLYVVPNFQNPTGLVIAQAKRRAVLEWAERHDLLVVEDDPYGDLSFADPVNPADTRPVKADDTGGRVVYLSTFSKTLAPAFRTAFIAAPAALASRFETAKQTLDLCTSSLDQHIVFEACRQGVLARQILKLRAIYRRKRDLMENALHRYLAGQASWTQPRGGFFLWVTLPEGFDASRLLQRALERHVIYVAGQPFFVDGSGVNTLRLAFSFVADERIDEGISRLAAAVIEEAQGVPTAASRQPVMSRA